MLDLNKQAQVIEEKQISDTLRVTTSMSFDELQLYLEVTYMYGKFSVQKSFANNYLGLEKLELAKKEFDSEEKVKQYFRLL